MNTNKKLSIINYQLSIFLIAVFFVLPLKAQVNIGSVEDPHQFSILELTTTKDNNGGLRMPQLDNDERNAVQAKFNENTATAEAAKGLIIYNTETGCLEFWNGKEWISLCSNILPPTPVLEVYPASITFDSNGSITSSAANIETVTTNQTNWTATITYNQGSGWITSFIPTSGTDGQQFTVKVADGATTVRTATITITAGGLTRYVTVAQFPDNYQDSSAPTNFFPYVGAFWRYNQTGERLIRDVRPTGNATQQAAVDGAWTAAVISGADWITLDTVMTSDNQIWTDTPKNSGNDEGFDTKYAVVNGSNMVSGTMNVTTPQIYFRIGLKDTLASADAAPRYGMVLLTNNNYTQRIWIRQGEAADYLFRSDDPVLGGKITTRTANQCRQFSPYNLTAATLGTMSVGINGASPNPGIWTAYPSQAGAFFQWANDNTGYTRYAWDSYTVTGTTLGIDANLWNAYPSTYWDALKDTHETCPSGYRRPTDGLTTGDITANAGGPTITSSEARQSLYLTPQSQSGINDVSNSVWGYYADGFFDRRQIKNGPGSNNSGTNSSVSTGNNQIAHIGRLYYNPYNNASLFFPAAGSRSYNNGSLADAGKNGYYWSSTSSSPSGAWYQALNGTIPLANQSYIDYRSWGYSIRCVKNSNN